MFFMLRHHVGKMYGEILAVIDSVIDWEMCCKQSISQYIQRFIVRLAVCVGSDNRQSLMYC
jgi:hypothetical protein